MADLAAAAASPTLASPPSPTPADDTPPASASAGTKPTTAPPPVPHARLTALATAACDDALLGVTSYEHARTEAWNTAIITSLLRALVAAAPAGFKFSVNSTIIQHLSAPPATTKEEGEGQGERRQVGRRGMHSATGAYWNNERDGMWCYKWEKGEQCGFDVVVSLVWVAVG